MRCRSLRPPAGEALIRFVSLHRLPSPVVFLCLFSNWHCSVSFPVRSLWLLAMDAFMVHADMSTTSVAPMADVRTITLKYATSSFLSNRGRYFIHIYSTVVADYVVYIPVYRRLLLSFYCSGKLEVRVTRR